MEDNVSTGGAPESDAGGKGGEAESAENVVKYSTYEKTLQQEKNLRARNAELQKQLDAIEAEKATAKEAALKQQEQYKELYEAKNQELERAQAERDAYHDNLFRMVKLNAVQNKLPRKVKRSEYLDLIDIEKVIIDDDGMPNEESVQLVADQFLKVHGVSLLEASKGNDLPTDSAQRTTTLSVEAWKKLPLKERKARMGEVYSKLKN